MTIHEIARQPRTTVYDLFHVQYLSPVPSLYPKYTTPCVRSLHLFVKIELILKDIIYELKIPKFVTVYGRFVQVAGLVDSYP